MRTYSFLQEWLPINPVYVPNQSKLMINSSVNKKIQIGKHIRVWFRNEGSCEPVNMSLSTSEHLLLVYPDEDKPAYCISMGD